MRPISCSLALLAAACATDPIVEDPPEPVSAEAAGLAVTVDPADVTAGQPIGGLFEAPLSWSFTVPQLRRGGGLPDTLNLGKVPALDRSLVQIELPVWPFPGQADEDNSIGAALFDGPRFCWVGESCLARLQPGYWRAVQLRAGLPIRELQLAVATRDELLAELLPLKQIIGAYLPSDQYLWPGDVVRFEYRGGVPDRANTWTGHPLRVHLRHRSFAFGLVPTMWTTLDDAEVQGLTIHPEAPAFVRAHAPLDVAAGEPFEIAVVITDRFGNPAPIDGAVTLGGDVDAELWLAGEYRKTTTAVYAEPGDYRAIPSAPGLAPVYHYSRAHDGPPPFVRMLGDVHIHTGDGGAQRKFIRSFAPGDHAALSSRMDDAYRYLETIAGYDFGAVSEHAMRDDTYALPPAVAADPAFAPGGACDGAGEVIDNLDGWWPLAQQRGRDYGAGETGRFVTFPAYEWHAQHGSGGDNSPLHRVVMFRDFDAGDQLPILPGDINGVSPHCLIRFLKLAGHDSSSALVIPHIMTAGDGNIDWELTYADTNIASRAEVEELTRVGEIFSARNYDQPVDDELTAFEGADQSPGGWTYRFAWRDLGAVIGVIGSSDNHSQTPGANDDVALDGSRYHNHEAAGTAAVLAATPGRDGIYDGLRARRSYATSGIRAWLDFDIGGAPMGSVVDRSADGEATIELLAGMPITRVELWAAPAGVPGATYLKLVDDAPGAETYARTAAVVNPAATPGETWVYYVRAFLHSEGDQAAHAHEAVWSSPIWIRWTP